MEKILAHMLISESSYDTSDEETITIICGLCKDPCNIYNCIELYDDIYVCVECVICINSIS